MSTQKKLLVVFGATGNQGSSIVNFVLNDKELSEQYAIRAIGRDTSSNSMQALAKKGVETVAANPDDEASLGPALKGAHTVYSMTFPSYQDVKNTEVRQGRAVADAAVAAGVTYLIFSTLPNVTKLTNGKYTRVEGFDAKAEVEEYIRTLPIKSAFFSPGSFMQNYHSMMAPRSNGDGTFSIARHIPPTSKNPLIDTAGDTGKWVGAILAAPDKFEGKVICAATRQYTMQEQAEILSKYTGKTVKYVQLSEDQMRSVLPPGYGDMLIEMMNYQHEFGYYGAETDELLRWSNEIARGKMATFEEYLQNNPLNLE